MKRNKKTTIDSLTGLQRSIVEAVWEAGEATVGQIQQALEKSKPLAYTTVLTLMRRLEEAGWLQHHLDGRTFVYQPAVSREQAARTSYVGIIDRLFKGKTGLLVQHLVEEENLSDNELLEIRKIIDRKRRKAKP